MLRCVITACVDIILWYSFTVYCSDPGEVRYATRSGEGPYRVGSRVDYTCVGFCVTGSGSITCQSNGEWTRKPACKSMAQLSNLSCERNKYWVESLWCTQKYTIQPLMYGLPPEKNDYLFGFYKVSIVSTVSLFSDPSFLLQASFRKMSVVVNSRFTVYFNTFF